MRLEFSGKNLSLTDALRNKAEHKLSKLERFTGTIVSAHASFEVERHIHHVDLVVHCSHDRIYKARGTAEDMYLAINQATDAIEQQAKKDKGKRLAGRAKTGAQEPAAAGAAAQEEEEEEAPPRRRAAPRVRRMNHYYSPKPMTLPDAALLIAETKAPVVVFTNLETGKLCVLFTEKDGRLGLVEPPA
jgi:putative sigma-54 modulation protein